MTREPAPREGGRQLGRDGPRTVGPRRSAQADRPGPFRGPVTSHFDLVAIRAIYSPGAKSHTSIHSSSTGEEQRREGHHLGEERVELVD
jgi:hypothetical protein